MEFPIPGWCWMDRNENTFFHSFSACPVLFWLEKKPQWRFIIFLIFLLFFWNSLFRVGLEWIRTRIFFFSHCKPVSSRFDLKRSHNDVFSFFKFFCHFFGIPYSGTGWNGSEREYFFFLILSLSFPVLAWKETTMTFFYFFSFFCCFSRIPSSGSGWNGSDWEFSFCLVLILSRPVLACEEAIWMFF